MDKITMTYQALGGDISRYVTENITNKQMIKLAKLVNKNPALFMFNYGSNGSPLHPVAHSAMLVVARHHIVDFLQDTPLHRALHDMGIRNIAVASRDNGQWCFNVFITFDTIISVTVVKKGADGEVKKMPQAVKEALALAMAKILYRADRILSEQTYY